MDWYRVGKVKIHWNGFIGYLKYPRQINFRFFSPGLPLFFLSVRMFWAVHFLGLRNLRDQSLLGRQEAVCDKRKNKLFTEDYGF